MSFIKTGTASGTAFQIVSDTTGNLVFQTGSGPSTTATITSTGVLLIGSSGVANSGDTAVLNNGATTTYLRLQTLGSGTGASDGSRIGLDGTGSLVIYNYEGGSLQLGTNDSIDFTINASGALGIGATPTYGTSGQVLTTGGSAAAPTWGTVVNSVATTGSGISVSAASGNVTFTNTGVTSVAAGTGITASSGTGAVTITNAGVTTFNGATGAITGVNSVNGQTGAATISYDINAAANTGDVGTYAWLAYGAVSTATIVAGTNYAGSGLRYWGYTGAAAAAATNTAAVAVTPAGTWKAMGQVNTTTNVIKHTLYLRVA